MSEKMFKLAAVLDPRWKMAWCKGDESVELKRIILEKVQANKPATNSSTSESAAGSLPKKRSKLIEFMDAQSPASTTSQTGDSLLLQVLTSI